MNFLVDIAPLTYGSIVFLLIVFGVGFTLGSFGGLFSECSGIINIASGSLVAEYDCIWIQSDIIQAEQELSLLVETKQISIYGVVISVCDIYIPTVGIDIDSIRSADIGSVRNEIFTDSFSCF